MWEKVTPKRNLLAERRRVPRKRGRASIGKVGEYMSKLMDKIALQKDQEILGFSLRLVKTEIEKKIERRRVRS